MGNFNLFMTVCLICLSGHRPKATNTITVPPCPVTCVCTPYPTSVCTPCPVCYPRTYEFALLLFGQTCLLLWPYSLRQKSFLPSLIKGRTDTDQFHVLRETKSILRRMEGEREGGTIYRAMNGSSNALLVLRVVRRVRTILIRRRCREGRRYGRALSGHDARKVLKDHAVSPLYRVMMNNIRGVIKTLPMRYETFVVWKAGHGHWDLWANSILVFLNKSETGPHQLHQLTLLYKDDSKAYAG